MTDLSNDRSAPSIAVVVAAHGSRADEANLSHHALVDQLATRCPWPLSAAFLELTEPSIPDAIDAAAASAAVVLVLPYFLHPGRHLNEDIPALVRAADDRHPDTSVQLLGAFGADPGVLDLLADQVQQAVADRG